MIRFTNGHEFNFVCASGAMAYLHGWPWEEPFRQVGLLDPHQFTVIVKTLTFRPREGNLKLTRWWRCVRLLENGSAINAVGLTNPGYQHWVARYYPKVARYGYKVIVSIMPNTEEEAHAMAGALDKCEHIKGLELNFSCPNVDHDTQVDHIVRMTEAVQGNCRHPVVVKLGIADPYLETCKALDGKVAAFDLINTVPWATHSPYKPSPLAKYNLAGGVSGRAIRWRSLDVLNEVVAAGVKTPIISGGGIDSYEEADYRFQMGAGAVSFGTVFMRTPWRPNRIIRRWNEEHPELAR